jgi:hypothetical protein
MDVLLLNKFEQNIEEEIKAYEELEILYKEKQSALVTGMVDKLLGVDSKILEKAEQLKILNSNRIETSRYLGDENLSMTNVIEKAKTVNEQLAKKLIIQKTKLGLLSSSLGIYEKTNMQLIKHGLTMTGKTLNIITNVLSPQSTQYNSVGKEVRRKDMVQISSIIEEA